MPKPRGDVEALGIRHYIRLFNKKVVKPDDGRYRPKHVVFLSCSAITSLF